jgi:hypothetical protein
MREQRDIDGPSGEVLRRGVVRGEAPRGRSSPAALSAPYAPMRPARRSEAARTSGSARSAHTKFSVSAGTIDGGDPPRAQEVVRRRYGSCPPRRQGSAPAPCAAQKGYSKDSWRQVGHDQLCHTSKIRADGWSGKACRPLLVLRARLKKVRQSGRGCIPSHGPQGDIQLQGLR